MANQPTRAAGSRVDRRDFVRTVAGAAGVLGAPHAFGGRGDVHAEPMPATQAPQARPAAAADEFPAPPGLKRGAQLDSRFPVSFAPTVSQGLRLVTEYFAALNQRDLPALSRTLHFPFAIYENIEPVVVNTAAELIASPPPTLDP